MHALDALPGLRLPRVSLGRWPTPIAALDLPGLSDPVWVKDEGACSPLYGGNKIRKLELLLAEARGRDRAHLLTLGAVGSHHVLATALHGRALGLTTHAVLFPQPDHPHVREVARAIAATCGSVFPVGSLERLPIGWARAWLRLRLRLGARPYRIAAGGSNALGTIGWIDAGLELAADVAAGRLPRPSRVYVPLGSGGTVAGLLVGLRLAGLDAEVVGVRVAAREVGNRINVRRLAIGAIRELRRRGARLPRVRLDGFAITHAWIGAGYGTADARVAEAMARASGAGMVLERTYTGRAFAACLDDAARRPGPVVFVQTVNSRPLPAVTGELPAALARMLIDREDDVPS